MLFLKLICIISHIFKQELLFYFLLLRNTVFIFIKTTPKTMLDEAQKCNFLNQSS